MDKILVPIILVLLLFTSCAMAETTIPQPPPQTIAASSGHYAIITDDGHIYAWKEGNSPELVEGIEHASSVSLSFNTGVAVCTDGTAWFWSYDIDYDHFVPLDRNPPVMIEGLSDAIYAYARDESAILLLSSGNVVSVVCNQSDDCEFPTVTCSTLDARNIVALSGEYGIDADGRIIYISSYEVKILYQPETDSLRAFEVYSDGESDSYMVFFRTMNGWVNLIQGSDNVQSISDSYGIRTLNTSDPFNYCIDFGGHILVTEDFFHHTMSFKWRQLDTDHNFIYMDGNIVIDDDGYVYILSNNNDAIRSAVEADAAVYVKDLYVLSEEEYPYYVDDYLYRTDSGDIIAYFDVEQAIFERDYLDDYFRAFTFHKVDAIPQLDISKYNKYNNAVMSILYDYRDESTDSASRGFTLAGQ